MCMYALIKLNYFSRNEQKELVMYQEVTYDSFSDGCKAVLVLFWGVVVTFSVKLGYLVTWQNAGFPLFRTDKIP